MKVLNKKMKVISKLYIPEAGVTSVFVPLFKMPSGIDSVIDSNGKKFKVIEIGLNSRLYFNGVADLHIKGNYTDNQVVSVTFKHQHIAGAFLIHKIRPE